MRRTTNTDNKMNALQARAAGAWREAAAAWEAAEAQAKRAESAEGQRDYLRKLRERRQNAP